MKLRASFVPLAALALLCAACAGCGKEPPPPAAPPAASRPMPSDPAQAAIAARFQAQAEAEHRAVQQREQKQTRPAP